MMGKIYEVGRKTKKFETSLNIHIVIVGKL